MFRAACSWVVCLLVVSSLDAAEAPKAVHYYDESTSRHLTVDETEFGKVRIEVRTAAPGSSSRWFGEGTRKDKEIFFAQPGGEEQEFRTFFIAKGGESKLEISIKPGQNGAQDAGINGIYRHITDEKRLSLARKEFGVAEDMLGQLLKTAPKGWSSDDRRVIADWKTRWPELLKRWMGLVYKPAATPVPAVKPLLGTAGRAGEAGGPEKDEDYWILLTESTAMALGFVGRELDKSAPPAWDGEYEDGFGGRVSARMGNDGILRFTLACTRGPGEGQTGELIGRIPAENVKPEKSGEVTARYTHNDAEVKAGEQQATVTLRKAGHFLFVETQYATRYHGRAWFDGIYRWGPVPVE